MFLLFVAVDAAVAVSSWSCLLLCCLSDVAVRCGGVLLLLAGRCALLLCVCACVRLIVRCGCASFVVC